MAESASPLRVVEETPAYWRVVFDYPPFNVMDGTMFQSLQDLLARMDASQTLRVVVFESAILDFYLAHFDGDTAERYGCINRALADAELDGFVDALARRIASFDRRAIAAAKNLINQVSLPSADRLLDALISFQTALSWTEAQQRVGALIKRGLQKDVDFEKEWPTVLGTLLARSPSD